MTWFRVDDGFHNHPKILAVGNAAVGLFVRLGSYCSQQLTDGFVPEMVARQYGTPAQLRRLAEVGLIEIVRELDAKRGETGREMNANRARNELKTRIVGYQIPEFLDFNPSAESVKEKRRKNAEKVARWRAEHAAGNHDVTGLHGEAVTRLVTLPPTRPDPTRPVLPKDCEDDPPRTHFARVVDISTAAADLAARLATGRGGS